MLFPPLNKVSPIHSRGFILIADKSKGYIFPYTLGVSDMRFDGKNLYPVRFILAEKVSNIVFKRQITQVNKAFLPIVKAKSYLRENIVLKIVFYTAAEVFFPLFRRIFKAY